MEKTSGYILLALGLLLLGLLCGFFLGRVYSETPILTAALPTSHSPSQAEDLPVNINTASATQLQSLPGIGEVLAQRIVAYRSSQGLFEKIEDITRVEGIGIEILAQIVDLITV